MAVLGKVAGTMLKDNLVRNGVDLIIDGNLMYYDVANRRIGINTITPGNALTVNGSVTASNVYVNNTSITALNGNLILNSLTGNINASTLRIFNVVDPVNNQDVATKNYVDTNITAISSPNLYIGNLNSGNTNVVLNSETLYLIGNTNQINVAITSNTATFSLASNLVIGNLNTTNGGQVIGYLTGAIGSNIANSGAFTTLTASSTSTLNTITAVSLSASTIGNSGATIQGDTIKSLNGGQLIGYHTGAIGANTANSGVFTSVTTVSGGQVTGYITGPIGANTANTGVFTSVTTVSGGQVTGYITGPIGANTANTGAFTTVTATGNITAANITASGAGGQLIGYHTGAIGSNIANTGIFTNVTTTGSSGNISGANYIFASLFSGNLTGAVGNINPNSGVFTNVTTVNGGQLTGYLTGAIGANTANTGAFTSLTASLTANVTGNINGFSYINSSNGFNWANNTPYGGYFTVSEINTANVLSNILTNITTLRFDRDTGIFVKDWGSNTAKISLGSSFATWIVSGQGNLKAFGEDKVEFKAGAGISITTDNTTVPQSITFTSTGNLVSANIGNLYLHNNTIDVINTDGNINLNPVGNGIVSINSTKAILLPSGNNLTRPPVPITGMLRYNTVINSLEIWDGADWLAVSGTSTTTIISDSFIGNGTDKNFTLSQTATTGGTLVSINGVSQIPDVSYSISGTTLSFIEAPLSSDVIEARILTTTASTTSMVVGNSYVNFGDAANGYPFNVHVSSADRVIFYGPNTTVLNNLVVTNAVVSSGSNISLTQNTLTTFDSFDYATYRTAKYIVSVSDFAGSKYQSAELIVNHNGTTASVSPYGIISTNGTNFVTFAASISGSNVIVQANSTSGASYCKFQQTYVTV
jgi:hypothetical protein